MTSDYDKLGEEIRAAVTPHKKPGKRCFCGTFLPLLADACGTLHPSETRRPRSDHADDYLENGPELVAEVAADSIPLDTGLKLQMYLRCDVQEYIIWRVPDQEIDWYVRRDDVFVQLTAGADGRLRSEVFPGLWLDPGALIRGDLAQVLTVLRQGIATAEHAAFVTRFNPPIS